jgi:hypothetical protein
VFFPDACVNDGLHSPGGGWHRIQISVGSRMVHMSRLIPQAQVVNEEPSADPVLINRN